MKRIVLILLCAGLAASVFAETRTVGDFTVTEAMLSGGLRIIGYIGYANDIVIPAYIDGKPVTEITGWSFTNKDITSVVFPNTLKAFENNNINHGGAFQGTYLKSVVIPDSVEYIGGSTFEGIKNLESVYLGQGVKRIEARAFLGPSTTLIQIPSGVEIGNVDKEWCFSRRFESFYTNTMNRRGGTYRWNGTEWVTAVGSANTTRPASPSGGLGAASSWRPPATGSGGNVFKLSPDIAARYALFGSAATLPKISSPSNAQRAREAIIRGDNYRKQGNYIAAIREYTEAIRLNPDMTAYNNRGIAYNRTLNFSGAIADFTQALRLSPNDAVIYGNRGNTYHKKGDYDSAIADFTVAIRLSPLTTEYYVDRGAAYQRKGDLDKAIADFVKALWYEPNHARAKSLLEAARKQQREQQNQQLALDALARGNNFYNKNNYDWAIVEYNQALRSDPNYATAYNNRGHAYFGKKDYGKAIADFEAALRLDPNHANAKVGLERAREGQREQQNQRLVAAANERGMNYYAQKDYDRAIAEFTQAIRGNPNYATYYSNRGHAYYGKNDYARAIADLEAALRLDPNHVSAKKELERARTKQVEAARLAREQQQQQENQRLAGEVNERGINYHKQGDYDRAIAEFTEAIRIKPNDAALYGNRGAAYYMKGDYGRAIADYEAALRLDPNNANAKAGLENARQRKQQNQQLAGEANLRGINYHNKGDYDRAIAEFTEAIRINPNNAEFYDRRGRAYFNKKDYDKAMADFEAALRLDPNNANAKAGLERTRQGKQQNQQLVVAANERGNNYYEQKDYDSAIREYTEAIRLNPNNAVVYVNRADAYYWKDDSHYDNVIADCTQALRINPNDARAYNSRGRAYREKDDYDKAIADYTQALRIKPNDAVYYRNRGNAYSGKGDYDKAIADFEAALRLNPNDGMAKDWLDNARAEREKQQ